MKHETGDTCETAHCRPLGRIGAGLFTLGPPAFLHGWRSTFDTTAVAENPPSVA